MWKRKYTFHLLRGTLELSLQRLPTSRKNCQNPIFDNKFHFHTSPYTLHKQSAVFRGKYIHCTLVHRCATHI